jgi:hypothetical protein
MRLHVDGDVEDLFRALPGNRLPWHRDIVWPGSKPGSRQ